MEFEGSSENEIHHLNPNNSQQGRKPSAEKNDKGSFDTTSTTFNDIRERLRLFQLRLHQEEKNGLEESIMEATEDEEAKGDSSFRTIGGENTASSSTQCDTRHHSHSRKTDSRFAEAPMAVNPPNFEEHRALSATPGKSRSLSNLLARPSSSSLPRTVSDRRLPPFSTDRNSQTFDHVNNNLRKAASSSRMEAPQPVIVDNSYSETTFASERHHLQPAAMTFAPEKQVWINGKCYQKLNLLGKGGSSKVWQVFDPEREACLAMKVVDLSDAEDMVRRAYENEISLLKKLQHSDRIVHLYEHESRGDEQILLMEKGDTDLGKYLKGKQMRREPLASSLIESYFREMLQTVSVIHKEGIIHSDLKPANFLLVGGNVKLIDFGIASTVPSNRTSVTVECQMGTLNYMSPEAIRNSVSSKPGEAKRVTTKSDVWSLGCILYSMVYGKTPFQHITAQYGKMLAIMGQDASRGRIQYPELSNKLLLDVLKQCLNRDPRDRPTVDELLEHAYFKEHKNITSPVESKAGLSEAHLKTLATTLGANSPNTNMRILKQVLGVKKEHGGDKENNG